ncbi:hypothetical protein [Acidovorax sp. K2F]|uniref:hypothetical protein n=1 Tax=Acidovorax sp. K2F TaxID=2978125 RepID=UPI0021B1572A|nr:hypothetical protein [Acidovorax sp. K2F]MCT6720603.1 hypothetical protein [Acidovorax sp. K2F]
MHPDLITQLVEAIYLEHRGGRFMPARIELGPDLFPKFQREHREALTAMLPEADNVYPGSLAGVPVVEAETPGAVLVRLDGARGALALPE